MPQCDIIIPTFNSVDVIGLTLRAIGTQLLPPAWSIHIICVDDGSSDATLDHIAASSKQIKIPVTLITQEHRGSATARNAGLVASRGDVVLFLNDDIVLCPHALAAHCQFHHQYPAPTYGALGWIGWDPRLIPSPLMEWMNHGGPQNNFDDLLGHTSVDPRRVFFGGQVSVKRSIIGEEKFSEKFQQYGWEDIEFGHRLADQGLQLHFLEQARGLHRHYYNLTDIRHRQYAVGYGADTYKKLHPDTIVLPKSTWQTRVKYYVATLLGVPTIVQAILRYSSTRWSTPRLFMLVTAFHFWHGVFSAQDRKK